MLIITESPIIVEGSLKKKENLSSLDGKNTSSEVKDFQKWFNKLSFSQETPSFFPLKEDGKWGTNTKKAFDMTGSRYETESLVINPLPKKPVSTVSSNSREDGYVFAIVNGVRNYLIDNDDKSKAEFDSQLAPKIRVWASSLSIDEKSWFLRLIDLYKENGGKEKVEKLSTSQQEALKKKYNLADKTIEAKIMGGFINALMGDVGNVFVDAFDKAFKEKPKSSTMPKDIYLNNPLPNPFKTESELKDFQIWANLKYPKSVKIIPNGIWNVRTQKAYALYGAEYLKSKSMKLSTKLIIGGVSLAVVVGVLIYVTRTK